MFFFHAQSPRQCVMKQWLLLWADDDSVWFWPHLSHHTHTQGHTLNSQQKIRTQQIRHRLLARLPHAIKEQDHNSAINVMYCGTFSATILIAFVPLKQKQLFPVFCLRGYNPPLTFWLHPVTVSEQEARFMWLCQINTMDTELCVSTTLGRCSWAFATIFNRSFNSQISV